MKNLIRLFIILNFPLSFALAQNQEPALAENSNSESVIFAQCFGYFYDWGYHLDHTVAGTSLFHVWNKSSSTSDLGTCSQNGIILNYHGVFIRPFVPASTIKVTDAKNLLNFWGPKSASYSIGDRVSTTDCRGIAATATIIELSDSALAKLRYEHESSQQTCGKYWRDLSDLPEVVK
jgi:hypothetical protein